MEYFNEEEMQKKIEETRDDMTGGPKTELKYYFTKLDFLERWIVGNVMWKINQIKAKEGGYEFVSWRLGTHDFEHEWKVKTGEIRFRGKMKLK